MKGCLTGSSECYQHVSVEPTMVLYMLAFMITSVVEQVFYVHIACSVDHGYPPEICFDLNNKTNSDIKNEVQVTVSTFHQWNGIAGHVAPIILAFFLGAYSDKRGRKGVMLVGLLGKLWFSFMLMVISTQSTWPLNYVIYLATIPSAFTGVDVAIFAAAFAYISDVSTPKNRTFRVGILDACYLSTMPTGVALGNFLFNSVVKNSFTYMFAINACLMVLSIVYSFTRLKWKTSPKHQSLKEAGKVSFFRDFFDMDHALGSIKTLLKKRPANRRTFLIIMMLSMTLYVFQRDEKPMLYLYTTKVFNWDSNLYSHFKTFQSVTFVVMMLIGIPLMSRVFKWKDTVIIMIGALSHAAGRFIFAFAKVSTLFYVGALVGSLGPCVAPVIRSMVSKIVAVEDKGKVFALLSVCDNAVTLFSATLYSQLYNATIDTNYPNAIFFLTIATQILVFLFAIFIHAKLGSDDIDSVTEQEPMVTKMDGDGVKPYDVFE